MSKLVLIILCALLAACSGLGGPVRRFVKGDELMFNDFSEPNTFEQASYAGARLHIGAGVYRIVVTEGDGTLWWGQWGDIYDNAVIDVDVNQLSERSDNMYGVMCRVRGAVGLPVTPDPELQAIMSAGPGLGNAPPEATEESTPETSDEATVEATAETEDEATAEATDEAQEETTQEAGEEATEEATTEATSEATEEATPEATAEATEGASAADSNSTLLVNNGDGYLFLIRGDGGFAIMRARGRDLQPLVGWGNSSAINAGPGQNHIRAVCVQDYLALYVNDQFVADAIDDTYTRGQVALAAASVDRLGVEIEFDNLSVSQATPEP